MRPDSDDVHASNSNGKGHSPAFVNGNGHTKGDETSSSGGCVNVQTIESVDESLGEIYARYAFTLGHGLDAAIFSLSNPESLLS